MIQIAASILIFVLAALGLGIGVLAGRTPLKGSCGGKSCEACAACPRHRS